MPKVDIDRYDFVIRDNGIQLEDKQSHKVIGSIVLDQSYIKEKSDLTFWDRFCTWTMGLLGLGKSWKKTVVFINSAGNAPKEYYIAKRSFPNLEDLKPVESPKVFDRPEIFPQPKKPEPAPTVKAKSSKLLLTKEIIDKKEGFFELRNLLCSTLNLPETCQEKQIIEAFKSKRKDTTVHEANRPLLKQLQEKYLAATIPGLFLSINEIIKINFDEIKSYRDFSCMLLEIAETKDLEKIADAYIAKYKLLKAKGAIQSYYFKKIINKAEQLLSSGLCLVLNLPEDSTKEDIKKAYKKWMLTNHPDKKKLETQREKDEATVIFQELNSYYKAYETLSKAE